MRNVIVFKLNILKSTRFSYSAISDNKVKKPRCHFMLQSENAARKSTIFHAVSNVQQNCAGIPWNEETIVKAQKPGQIQQMCDR